MHQDSDQKSLGLVVADHVSAMLAYWDKNLVCRFANAAYHEWFGKTREEMVNKMTMQQLQGPELFEQNLPFITGALAGKPQTFERTLNIPSGETRYSLANYFPNIIHGEVVGFFAHVADITPIKLLEQELQQSNETIKQQNKRLLNFANIVTHNLRSYAGNLSMILELFVAAKSDVEKDEMLSYIKDISAGFTNTIIHLSEIVEVQNTDHIKLRKINLNDYINRSIRALGFELISHKAVIHNNVSTDIFITANAPYMDSVLLNLLTNALKYRHPARDPIITLDATVNGNEVIFSIKDNGLGINLQKYKDDLFGMYKTFHGNPDAKGVGLYLVRSQIEAMGGSIDVESEVGTGTTFIMRLKG